MKKEARLIIMIPIILMLSIQTDYASEEKVPVHIAHLEKSLYRITYTLPYTFVHLASIGKDGIFLIDTGVEKTAHELLPKLKKIGNKNVTFILNTHAHQDHIGGNPVFAGEAPILAHINVRKRYLPPDSSSSGPQKKGAPTITFEDTITLYMNGQTIIVQHVPSGHTDGDVTVYFPESKILFIGDLIIPGRFSTVDLELGGDVDGFLMNLKSLINDYPDDTRYIPTHGSEHTKDALKHYSNAFAETYSPIKEELKQGKTVQQIVESRIFDNYRDWLRKEHWVEVILKKGKNSKT